MGQKMETDSMHQHLYHLAFIKGDAAGMKEQLDWARSKSPRLSYERLAGPSRGVLWTVR